MTLCSAFQAKAQWDSASRTCVSIDTHQFLSNLIFTFCCEMIFVLMMFVGVLRNRSQSKLWRLLYHQVCSDTYIMSSEVSGFSFLYDVISRYSSVLLTLQGDIVAIAGTTVRASCTCKDIRFSHVLLSFDLF